MNVLYLKATSEAALIAALPFARMTSLDGQNGWIAATAEYALDIIGIIYNEDAVYVNGVLVTPATSKPGFHANLNCNDRILALIPIEIIIIPPPNKILRQWA